MTLDIARAILNLWAKPAREEQPSESEKEAFDRRRAALRSRGFVALKRS